MTAAVRETAAVANLDPETVIRAVCLFRGIDRADLLGEARAFTSARHELAYMLRTCTTLSLARIGEVMAGRDHTCVVNSVNRVRERMLSDPEYLDEIDQMRLACHAPSTSAETSSEPAMLVARRLRAARMPDPADVERLVVAILMLRAVLASAELSAGEARLAALTLLGEPSHV